MLQTPKFLQSPTKLLHPPPPPPQNIPQVQQVHTSQSFHTLKQCCKFSRRELAIRSNSLLLFLLGFQGPEPFKLSEARAEEENNTNEDVNKLNQEDTNAREEIKKVNQEVTNVKEEINSDSNSTTTTCSDKSLTKKAFLDISIDGKPVGRIVIGLYGNDAPIGSARFASLVSGRAGISYRRKEFVKIMPNYVQHGGVRSYGVDAELAKRTGSNLEADNLVDEWERVNEKCRGTKNLAGTVSIVVRDPSRPPPKLKLVARRGNLEIDEEEVGKAPNGTEFIVSLKDSPEVDASALVVGRVLEGMEVVEKIGQVKTVQENTSSPYFR